MTNGRAVDEYFQLLLDGPDDFTLVNEVFKRVQNVADGGDLSGLRTLSEPQRIVLHVVGSDGLIGNGGFEYLFTADLVDFKGMAEAFAAIGATRAAAAFRDALQIFPDRRPQSTVDERRAFISSLGPDATAHLDQCATRFYHADDEIVERLATYIRDAPDLFSSLAPNRFENLAEQRGQNLPTPRQDASLAEVERWLRSIRARFDVDESNSRIVSVSLARYRRSTRQELDDLSQLSVTRHLNNLRLLKCRLTDDDLIVLSKFSSLENVGLNGTPITDAGLVHVGTIVSLQQLELAVTRVTGDGIEQLKNLKQLQTLRLASTAVGDEGVRHLTDLPSLEVLVLFKCPVTDRSVDSLASMTHLKSLSIRQTEITPEGIARLQQLLPSCEINAD